jgi:hypothetical protein
MCVNIKREQVGQYQLMSVSGNRVLRRILGLKEGGSGGKLEKTA